MNYGYLFETKMMDLSVNMALEDALDMGWQILKTCFSPQEVGIRSELVKKFWPEDS